MTNAEQAPIGNLPTREAIGAQLTGILESETLSTSDRSKAFLTFVVRQSLLWKGARVEGTVEGANVPRFFLNGPGGAILLLWALRRRKVALMPHGENRAGLG